MSVNYVINGKEYLDALTLRQELRLSKSEFQYLERTYPFPKEEIIEYKNMKLYSIDGLMSYLSSVVAFEEKKEKLKWH